MEDKRKWIRDLLVVPIIVAIVAFLVSYGVPKLTEKNKELSYEIEGPTLALKKSNLADISITVNKVPISELFSYRVRLWNSGGVSLRNIPIRIVFSPAEVGFKIFGVGHSTTPEHEFGNISEEEIDKNSRRFMYEFLHEGNQDIITIVANKNPSIQFFANIEGVSIKRLEQHQEKGWAKWSLVSALMGFVSSLVSVLFISSRRYFGAFRQK